jgi:hypothetical protein
VVILGGISLKKILLILVLLSLFVVSTASAATVVRTYTVQDKFFKPESYGVAAKTFFHTTSGRVIFYWSRDDVEAIKIYFRIKVGHRYTFELDGDKIIYIYD